MSPPNTLLPRDAGSTPPGGPSAFSLPPELLRQGRRRVVGLAMVIAIVNTFSFVATFGMLAPEGIAGGPLQWAYLGGVLSSVALVAVGMAQRVPDTVVRDLGLVYEIFLCLVIGIFTPWFFHLNGMETPHLTWTSVLIAVFPIIVPTRPALAVGVALVAAATTPLGLWIGHWIGGFDIVGPELVGVTIGPLCSVALAWFGARTVHGLGVDLARARQLGAYVLEEKLGGGGMGEVWRARHRLLARPAAIKLVRTDLATDRSQLEARFEREAQVTAQLGSPHTVELYDFGITEDGRFYYVMELLDGVDLDTLVTRWGPLPPGRVVCLLRQVCDSLAEAHGRGLVHRDLKPSNVFTCRKALQADFVKVLDFGLVTPTAARDLDGARLTQQGVVPGTPAFLAPEAARGQALDGRADLYALGCVAYWLLSGCLVFEGATPLEIVGGHLNKAPVPPSRRTDQPIPEALERLVMMLLAKEPSDRPLNAEWVAATLDALELDDPWTPERARRWWSRNFPTETVTLRVAQMR